MLVQQAGRAVANFSTAGRSQFCWWRCHCKGCLQAVLCCSKAVHPQWRFVLLSHGVLMVQVLTPQIGQ